MFASLLRENRLKLKILLAHIRLEVQIVLAHYLLLLDFLINYFIKFISNNIFKDFKFILIYKHLKQDAVVVFYLILKFYSKLFCVFSIFWIGNY